MTKRKLISLIIIFIATAFLKPESSLHQQEYAFVTKVIDGDTIKMLKNNTVRYIGINAPESNEYLYEESKQFNKKMVEKKKVLLKFDIKKYDHYNRILAYVYTMDSKFVNAELIRNGYAYFYPHPFETLLFNELLNAQRYAISNNLGIFKKLLIETSSYYIGNKNSLRFHRPNCEGAAKMSKKNKLYFKNKKEAYWNGYAPCKKCNP